MPAPAPPRRAGPVPAAVRPVRLFALCLVAAVIASTLPLPWRVGAVVFLLVAAVSGVRALLALAGSGRPGQVALVSCLLALCAVMLLAELALALWPAQWEYQECLREAITVSGREACEDELRSRLAPGLLPPRS